MCDRTAEQLISRSFPHVHPLIRSQIQHMCAQTANMRLVNEIQCCQKLFTDLIQEHTRAVSACNWEFSLCNKAAFLSLRN